MKKVITKIYCDRCGKEILEQKPNLIEFLFKFSYIETINVGCASVYKRSSGIKTEKNDLCINCYKSYKKWYQKIKI
jgi:protein-arginine kinase activator protein McsA